MKINEIKKEVVVKTEYIANDNTKFTTKESCEEYEKTCKCVIMAQYNAIVKKSTSLYSLTEGTLLYSSEDEGIDIVEIRDENDLYTVNKAIACYCNSNFISSDYIGKTIMLFRNYENEITGYFETIDELIEKIKGNYEKLLTNS